MTVRMDSKLKQQFNELCNEIGMSINTAINIFANAVVRTRSIPFKIEVPAKADALTAIETFKALRAEAEENGLQELTLDEINEEIRLAREEMNRRKKISV